MGVLQHPQTCLRPCAEPKTSFTSNFEVYLGKSALSECAGKPFNNSSITSWELKQFSKYRWGWVQRLKVGTYACGTLQANRYPPPFKTAYQAEAWGNSPTNKGNQLVTVWFDNCQVAVLSSNFSLNQTVTVRRMKEAPHVKSIPSLRAISTWEVLIWKTSWDLTIPLVAQELGGGDTFCGSSLMLRS